MEVMVEAVRLDVTTLEVVLDPRTARAIMRAARASGRSPGRYAGELLCEQHMVIGSNSSDLLDHVEVMKSVMRDHHGALASRLGDIVRGELSWGLETNFASVAIARWTRRICAPVEDMLHDFRWWLLMKYEKDVGREKLD